MKLIIDIGHPAHVHLFKNLAFELLEQNHKVLFTVRVKPLVIELLSHYKLPYREYGTNKAKILSKIFDLPGKTWKLLKIALKFKPDLLISHGSFYASYVALFLKRSHISLEDTGNMEQIRLYKPFTKLILSPECFGKDLGKKQVRYPGFHETAYIQPSSKAGRLPFDDIGQKQKRPSILIRFVEWSASHDFQIKALSEEEKNILLESVSKFGDIRISSEYQLPDHLKPFQLEIKPEDLLDNLHHFDLLISESATMASECAHLGIPSIYIDYNGRYYTDYLEKEYGIIKCFKKEDVSDVSMILIEVKKILNQPKDIFRQITKRIFEDSIDLTAYLVWIVSYWPESNFLVMDDPAKTQRPFLKPNNSKAIIMNTIIKSGV